MPLHIPTLGERVTEADIWDYATRILTDPASYKADVSALLANAHFDLAEFEKCQAPPTQNNVVAIVTTVADQSLGSKDITVDIPAGATITKVIAAARINIMNDSATAQKVDLNLIVGGVTLFDQADIIGFGAVDGASGSYVIAEDASDEVTADGQVVTLEAEATISAAASVKFQVQYYLFITYKMG